MNIIGKCMNLQYENILSTDKLIKKMDLIFKNILRFKFSDENKKYLEVLYLFIKQISFK